MHQGLLLGVVADTHGVFDPDAAQLLKGVDLLLHAGDVGHHGGHTEVLKAFAEATCAPVLAVSGNVDGVPGAAQLLPPHRVIDGAGWKLLLVHIVAPGPKQKVDATATSLIIEHQPDLVVFGHSHKAAHWQADGMHFVNPGSAGPARFKLKRSVARLWLPHKQASDAVLQITAHAADCAQAAAPPPPPPAAALPGSSGPKLSADAPITGQQGIGQGWLEFLQLAQKAPPKLKQTKQT